MSTLAGDLAYDLVDLGLSVHGKLKLVPKINEYGNPVRRLYHYGRKDLERIYKQINSRLLIIESLGDAFSLSNILKKMNNIVIFDENNLAITKPEEIINVKNIVDDCSLVIRVWEDEQPNYYLCTKANGEEYKKFFDGDIIKKGVKK